MIFLEADLSQIESRIVFLLSGDPELQRLALLPSYEYDAHSQNAALLFHGDSLAIYDVTRKLNPKLAKQQRHVGKITSHGAQRDMHGDTLSRNILKELGILIQPEKCDGYIAQYHAKYPGIQGGYFRDIRRRVMRERMLMNSWGRCIYFDHDRIDAELFRQAYSFLPQSENADCLSQHGVLPLWMYMESMFGYPPNVQVHDSLLVSVQPVHAYDAASFLQKNLEKPIKLGGVMFRPFVEFKLGRTWAGDEEFKKLPDKAVFTAAAKRVEAGDGEK